jgi:hypothetical protein
MAATPQFTVGADTEQAGGMLVVGATSPGIEFGIDRMFM